MGFFDSVDKVLDGGGGLALDALGMIPGVNVVTEAAQGIYHGVHAGVDLAEGDYSGAAKEGGSALWHGGLSLLNAFTGEGGEALEAGADAVKVGEDVAGVAKAGEDVAGVAKAGEDVAAATGDITSAEKVAAGIESPSLKDMASTYGSKVMGSLDTAGEEIAEHGGGVMGTLKTMAGDAGEVLSGASESAGGLARAAGEVWDVGADATNLVGTVTGHNPGMADAGGALGMLGAAAAGLPGKLEGGMADLLGLGHEEAHPAGGASE